MSEQEQENENMENTEAEVQQNNNNEEEEDAEEEKDVVNADAEIQNEYDDMPKIEVPMFEKNKGNECFAQGNLQEALKHYSKAQLAVSYLTKDQVINEEQLSEFGMKVLIPCQLNSSLCYIRMKDYASGKAHAEKALELDKENIKGLTRRAICLRKMHKFTKAESDLHQALNLLQENEQEQKQFILQEFQNLKQDRETYNQKLKKASKQMMDGLDYSDKKVENNKNQSSDQNQNSKSENVPTTFTGKISKLFKDVKEFFSSICCRKRQKIKPIFQSVKKQKQSQKKRD